MRQSARVGFIKTSPSTPDLTHKLSRSSAGVGFVKESEISWSRDRPHKVIKGLAHLYPVKDPDWQPRRLREARRRQIGMVSCPENFQQNVPDPWLGGTAKGLGQVHPIRDPEELLKASRPLGTPKQEWENVHHEVLPTGGSQPGGGKKVAWPPRRSPSSRRIARR